MWWCEVTNTWVNTYKQLHICKLLCRTQHSGDSMPLIILKYQQKHIYTWHIYYSKIYDILHLLNQVSLNLTPLCFLHQGFMPSGPSGNPPIISPHPMLSGPLDPFHRSHDWLSLWSEIFYYNISIIEYIDICSIWALPNPLCMTSVQGD